MLYAAAALSGFTIAATFLRFGLFPLAWVAFTPLLWALRRADSPRRAARLGLVAGLATNIPAFYWLVYTIHVFGGFPYPVAAFFYLTLSFCSSLQFVIFALAVRRVGPGPLAIAAPLLWVSLELLFPNLFPWRMAHTQIHVPALLQIGDLTGPYSLSLVVVWLAAALARWIDDRRAWHGIVTAGVAAACIAVYGVVRLPQIDAAIAAAPQLRVALVQGNIGIEEKGNISYFDINVEQYRQLSAAVQDQVDLIVWPETVQLRWIDAELQRLTPATDPFPDLRRHLIFGGLGFRLRSTDPDDAEEYNSAFLIGPGARVLGRYDKRILMPFGEFIPFASYFPWIRKLSPQTAGFTAGRDISIFDIDGKGRVGQLICYEDLVTDMPRTTTQGGAELLVTILNDAWYGNTAAPHQHQALALMRTIENRRYLLRGSNSGVTSIIDAAGRVVQEGPLFASTVLIDSIPRLQLASIYTRTGDLFAWAVVIAAAILSWAARSGPAAGRDRPRSDHRKE